MHVNTCALFCITESRRQAQGGVDGYLDLFRLSKLMLGVNDVDEVVDDVDDVVDDVDNHDDKLKVE